jgi:WD40 repeat protein
MRFFLCGFALILLAGLGSVATRAAEKLPSIEVVPNLPKTTVSLAMSPDGTLLASGEYDGSIQLWEFRSGRLLRTLSRHTQQVLSVKFVADGKQIISASKDLTVKLWDAETGQLLRTSELISPADYTWDVKLSPDGLQMASAQTIKGSDRAGVIKLWDAATGRLIRSFRASAIALAFTADGKRIVGGGGASDYKPGGQITLWDVTSGRLLRTFEQKGLDTVYRIAISPDGTRILSGSSGLAAIWDASTGRNLHSFTFKEFVETVAF